MKEPDINELFELDHSVRLKFEPALYSKFYLWILEPESWDIWLVENSKDIFDIWQNDKIKVWFMQEGYWIKIDLKRIDDYLTYIEVWNPKYVRKYKTTEEVSFVYTQSKELLFVNNWLFFNGNFLVKFYPMYRVNIDK